MRLISVSECFVYNQIQSEQINISALIVFPRSILSLFLLLPCVASNVSIAAKLVHGRPHKLNASWYCNVVGHYAPRDDRWKSMNHAQEAEFSVPPKWANEPSISTSADNVDSREIETIEFRGGMKEPGCYDGWCRSTSDDLVRWKGPSGTDNQWVDANGEIHEFVGRNSEVEEL